MENRTAAYGMIGVIVAAIIAGIVTLYIYNDTKSEQKKAIELAKEANNAKDTANLTISEIHMPEINTELDSYFLMKITNNSLNDAVKLNVKVNFGEAEVLKCEAQPINTFDKNQTYKSSIITFDIDSIQKKDSVYLYCLISSPIFNSILITGPNLFHNEKFTFEEYKSNEGLSKKGSWGFFQIIGAIVFLVFTTYFVVIFLVIINGKLEKKFGNS